MAPGDERPTGERLATAIDLCVERNILRDYLTDRREEVMTIMEVLFDQEIVWDRFISSEKRESRIEGQKEGREVMAALYHKLREENKLDEYDRAMDDLSYYEELLDRYGLNNRS